MVPTGVVEDTAQPRRGETMRSIMMRVREMPVVRILLEQHALSIVVHGMVTHGHHPSHSTRFPVAHALMENKLIAWRGIKSKTRLMLAAFMRPRARTNCTKNPS